MMRGDTIDKAANPAKAKKPKLRGRNRVTSPRRLKALERRREAAELRKQGCSFDEIAQRLGFSSRQTAWVAVKEFTKDVRVEAAAEMKKDVHAVLLDIRKQLYPKMLNGDLGAMEVCLKSLNHLARVFGLNEPMRQDVTMRAPMVKLIDGVDDKDL